MNAWRDDELEARLSASAPRDLTAAEERLLARVLARAADDVGPDPERAGVRHVAWRRTRPVRRDARPGRVMAWAFSGVVAAAAVVSAIVLVIPALTAPVEVGELDSLAVAGAPEVSGDVDGARTAAEPPSTLFSGSADPDDRGPAVSSGEAPTFVIEKARVKLPKPGEPVVQTEVPASTVVTEFIARANALDAADHAAFLSWLLAQSGVKSLGVAADPTDPTVPPRRGVVVALPREASGVRQRFLVSEEFDRVYAWSLVGSRDQGIAYATFP